MKIAVAYQDGMVFEHFGKAESFQVYEVEENRVVSVENVPANGSGHSAMVALMKELGIDTVICGGIGEPAKAALEENGIMLAAGVAGDADEAVAAYLSGALVSDEDAASSQCGCGEEGDACGGDCGSDCGSDCGGGCSGCGGGALQITLEGPNAGKRCRVHYRGTFNDGTQFDSSYDRGQTLDFICGAGQMIKGFDQAVVNMEVGQEIDIHLMPEEAYGMPDPDAVFTLEIAQLPGSEGLSVGQQVYLTNQFGQQFPVKVTAKDDTSITFDANHEMAGKELNFHILLVAAEEM